MYCSILRSWRTCALPETQIHPQTEVLFIEANEDFHLAGPRPVWPQVASSVSHDSVPNIRALSQLILIPHILSPSLVNCIEGEGPRSLPPDLALQCFLRRRRWERMWGIWERRIEKERWPYRNRCDGLSQKEAKSCCQSLEEILVWPAGIVLSQDALCWTVKTKVRGIGATSLVKRSWPLNYRFLKGQKVFCSNSPVNKDLWGNS